MVRFFSLSLPGQLSCLHESKDAGSLDEPGKTRLASLLERCDGKTDHRVVAGLLDLVRRHGAGDPHLAETVAALLPHQADLFQGRDRWYVLRLRAYMFATLADIGFPDSALPMLVDALAYVDERMSAVEFGAAARVVATLGPEGRRFIPYLMQTIGLRLAEEKFSLDRYETEFPPEEATTVEIEAVRSIGAVGTLEDEDALTLLRAVTQAAPQSMLDPRLVEAAQEGLLAMEARAGSQGRAGPGAASDDAEYATPWLDPNDRRRPKNIDIPLVDQDGQEHTLDEVVDRPTFLTFFYSRCQNAGKCSTAVARLAGLQKDLEAHGLSRAVRLLAITYEPEFDTPLRLKRYSVDRGLKLGQGALAVRLDVQRHASLLKDLETPVGYNAGWVNTHGVEAVLLDGEGRLARKYKTVVWDNAAVIRDLKRLLAGE